MARWLSRVVVAIAVLVITLNVRAQSPDNLPSFQSRSFSVSSDAPRTVTGPVAEYMDVMYASYRKLLPSFAPRNSQRSTLYLMSDQDAYHDLLRRFGMDGRNTGGVFFFNAVESGLATWVSDRSRYRLKEVLQHEGFHQFARTHIGGAFPTWANEGLAEYFGYGVLVGRDLETGLVPPRPLKRVQDAIEQDLFLPFDDLLRMDNLEWGRRLRSGDPRAAVAYDQSWSVVHFLLNADDRKYARAFEKFIQLTSGGMDIENSLSRAFGSTNFKPFQNAWIEYTQGLGPDPLSVMVERLAFLGEGILTIYQGGETVESLEDLKTKLRAMGFAQEFGSHGGSWRMSAEDDEPFTVPAPEGRRRAIELELAPPRRNEEMPTLRVEGLRARVGTVWIRGINGRWLSDVLIR